MEKERFHAQLEMLVQELEKKQVNNIDGGVVLTADGCF